MEYAKAIKELCKVPSEETLQRVIAQAKSNPEANLHCEVYEVCFNSLDLTTLSNYDSCSDIEAFVTKIVDLPKFYPKIGNIASVGLYPNFVETAGLVIGNSNIAISAFTGNFPSSQTFLEVKMLETAMTVEQGADEIETGLNIGSIAQGEYELSGEELKMLRDEAGEDTIFKVTINTMTLTPDQIYKAVITSITAGADFITVHDTTSAVIVCLAIKEYNQKIGKRIGIKLSDVTSSQDAAIYHSIVTTTLGAEWIENGLLRIGGGADLANNLLSAITNKTENYF